MSPAPLRSEVKRKLWKLGWISLRAIRVPDLICVCLQMVWLVSHYKLSQSKSVIS